MTEEKAVVYAQDAGDGIRVIYLNQPKKKNAISAPMMDILSDLLRAADDDDDVRVVVLRGAGENFSSGGDLNQGDGGKPTPEQARKTLRRYLNAVRTIRAISKPVMCMVDGYAVGGAFALALASNIGVAPSVSVSSAVDYMSASRGTRLIATCNVDKSGRHLGFYTTDVTDDTGRRIARVTTTVYREAE